jgi:hypothetical protein
MIATHTLARGLPANEGFELAFLIGTVGALVAACCVLLIPGRAKSDVRSEPVGAAV